MEQQDKDLALSLQWLSAVGSIPGPRTSTCCGRAPASKKKKKKERKKETKREGKEIGCKNERGTGQGERGWSQHWVAEVKTSEVSWVSAFSGHPWCSSLIFLT